MLCCWVGSTFKFCSLKVSKLHAPFRKNEGAKLFSVLFGDYNRFDKYSQGFQQRFSYWKNGAVFPTRCQNSEAEKVDAANGEWAMASIADRYEEMKRSIGWCVVSPTWTFLKGVFLNALLSCVWHIEAGMGPTADFNSFSLLLMLYRLKPQQCRTPLH